MVPRHLSRLLSSGIVQNRRRRVPTLIIHKSPPRAALVTGAGSTAPFVVLNLQVIFAKESE